jgi:hypothetical protein
MPKSKSVTDRDRKETTLPAIAYHAVRSKEVCSMASFFLWCVLLVLCWPLALIALVLYPIIWLLLLPFRLVGIAVTGVFELLRAVILLPARVLSGPSRV